MSEKLEIGGKSRHEVATEMAHTILISIEKKSWSAITRQEYLETVVQCAEALSGIRSK